MKLLLDTHVVLWWLEDPTLLSDFARDAISEPENEILVSAVVAWEIAIKRGLGKLAAPSDLRSAIELSGFTVWPVTFEHALGTEMLPWHHRDPFDRLLIAQAIAEDAVLVTRDASIPAYDIETLHA